jgi:ParB-like chromosome segregation protein Spo0J
MLVGHATGSRIADPCQGEASRATPPPDGARPLAAADEPGRRSTAAAVAEAAGVGAGGGAPPDDPPAAGGGTAAGTGGEAEAAAHPCSALFPMMAGPELERLAGDIARHGLREPVLLHRDGRVIDGRNRLRACRLAGVEPACRTYEGDDADLLDLVVSRNLHRRHLNESQRAMIAARLEGTGRGRPGKDADLRVSRARAAGLMRVSPRLVADAKAVLREGSPEVVRDVEAGRARVSRAAATARSAKAEAPVRAPRAARGERPGHLGAPLMPLDGLAARASGDLRFLLRTEHEDRAAALAEVLEALTLDELRRLEERARRARARREAATPAREPAALTGGHVAPGTAGIDVPAAGAPTAGRGAPIRAATAARG